MMYIGILMPLLVIGFIVMSVLEEKKHRKQDAEKQEQQEQFEQEQQEKAELQDDDKGEH
ncbi:hypothetical protein [Staphylococcus arlettae]|uniref:hypothetical protein n=1 Tax=Staphylococcus arlettae TaxID=29378 RepID=UPI00113D0A24|nr:hypothetical protein [Staphylococcus arlettae]MCD9054005.1 hypothetical protein [Staphylococcus arlettae]BBK27078.1 hypothetical protein SAP2_02620 [Staphylococcus arlettae]